MGSEMCIRDSKEPLLVAAKKEHAKGRTFRQRTPWTAPSHARSTPGARRASTSRASSANVAGRSTASWRRCFDGQSRGTAAATAVATASSLTSRSMMMARGGAGDGDEQRWSRQRKQQPQHGGCPNSYCYPHGVIDVSTMQSQNVKAICQPRTKLLGCDLLEQ